MKNKKAYKLIVFFIIAITFMIPKEAFASPHFNLSVSSGDTPADYVDSIKILIFFTMLTLLPYLEELEKELGPVDEILKEGRIKEITKWLNEKIHWYGSTRTPKEVIANVCGKEVSAEPLVRYFEKKYASVYDLK